MEEQRKAHRLPADARKYDLCIRTWTEERGAQALLRRYALVLEMFVLRELTDELQHGADLALESRPDGYLVPHQSPRALQALRDATDARQ